MHILHLLMAICAFGGTETNTLNVIKNWPNKEDKHFLLSAHCRPHLRERFVQAGIMFIDLPHVAPDTLYGPELQYGAAFTQALESGKEVNPSQWPPFFGPAVNAINEHAIDVIHAVNWPDVFYGRLLAFITKKPFVPFIHLNPKTFEEVVEHLKSADQLTAHLVDCTYYAVSKATADGFKEVVLDKAITFSAQPVTPRVEVVLNGIDTKVFQRDEKERKRLRQELGIPPSAFVIGGVGHLVSRKRFQWLVRRIAAVVQKLQRNDIYAVIVGDGPEKPFIARVAREVGLKDHIKLVGPQYPVAPWYSVFDIFVQSSMAECHSMVVIEAISSGLPCVVTEQSRTHPTITDGSEGFITLVDEDKLFEERLEQLIVDSELREKMGKKARVTAVSQYDVCVEAQKYYDIFKKTIAQKTDTLLCNHSLFVMPLE